jgi:hypothetical protein
MLMRWVLPFFLLLTTTGNCVAQEDLNWDRIAHQIVDKLDLKRGEKVLFAVKGRTFAPIVDPLRDAVAESNAVDLGSHDAESTDLSDRELRLILEDADVMVILPGALPTHAIYRIMQGILREGRKRTVHFHWEGAIQLPGHEPPAEARVNAVYQKALLDADYTAIAEHQKRFAKDARKGEVRVTTPSGTDLTFRVGDRPINFQNGDASAARARKARMLIDREIELPCGVIRVAPKEETVNGWIVIPDGEWAGRSVSHVKLRVEAGRVVEILSDDGDEGVAAVRKELDAGGGAAYSFREFALGFNPLLAAPEDNGWIPYYGYGAGVVRLSLGDNSELAGKVKGPYVRWNFFVGATVQVKEKIWVQGGKLLSN